MQTGWMGSKNGKRGREMSGQDISLRECFAQNIDVLRNVECTIHT